MAERPSQSRLNRRVFLGLAIALGAAGPTLAMEPFAPRPRPSQDFPNISYADWSDDEPLYRFYPGDEVEVTVISAPELNKTVTVGQDGRISLPLIGPVMAADRTVTELQDAITMAYSSQLLRPQVDVAARTTQPLRVFVGGEVDRPGMLDMPGDIDALRAIVMAGGFRTSARRDHVVIIRRGRDNRPMMRVVNLTRVFADPAHADLVPLRRFDIVYVPRTRVSEAGLFVQQWLRDLIPFGFSYAINGVSAGG